MEGDQENPKRRDLEEKEEEGDFPGDGKLRVKLRIGQKAMKALAGDSPEKKDHVCGECNKRFSSGKALGGHMSSAHVQANRDYSYKRKQLRRGAGGKGSGDDDEEESGREYYRGKDGKITCYHCGKNFPSTKSLFGHMRCHPDRGWRGMDPPLSTNNNIFDDTKVVGEQKKEEENQEVDLLRYLWSWSSTAKRGRSPIINPAYSSSDDEEKELREASQHLVSLVNGDSHHHLNSTQSPNLETLNPNLEIEKNGGLGLMSNKGKGRVILESRSSSEDEDDYYSEERSNPNSKNLDSSSPNKKKKIILENNNNNNCDKFKCSTCNKCFSSHQALGGHRSSHNKFKISIHNAIDECISAVSGDENNGENDKNNNGANAISKLGIIDSGGVIHECSVCNKIFATARGLGGHKKCHSAAQSSQMQEVEGSLSSSTPTTNDGQPKILDFDLNEIPDQTWMDQVD